MNVTTITMTKADAKKAFQDYQAAVRADRYQEIRDACKALAQLLTRTCPASRERSLALTKLEEVGMWANKAIAVHES